MTIVFLALVAAWNENLTALVILTSQFDTTLPVVLAYAQGELSVDYGMMSAAIVLAIARTIAIYVVVKDRLIGGMTLGAVNG